MLVLFSSSNIPLYMGPLQNLKVGPQGLPLKFKSGTPSPFFNEFIFFSEYFISFLLYYFLSFLNKMQKNINCEWQKSILSTKDKKVHMTRKHLSAETEQKIAKLNPIEVITFLNRHRLAILLEIHL